MQQDAIERVREMQRRAREKLESSNRAVPAVPSTSRPVSHVPAVSQPETSPAQPFQGILEKLGIDGETALILILLLLLLNEGADRSLILALVYILMV